MIRQFMNIQYRSIGVLHYYKHSIIIANIKQMGHLFKIDCYDGDIVMQVSPVVSLLQFLPTHLIALFYFLL